MGSALYPERCFHLINSSGAIFDDHISSRLSYFHPRNLVADRRAWSYCPGDGPAALLVSPMDPTGYRLPLSTRNGPASMRTRRTTSRAPTQIPAQLLSMAISS